MELIIIIFLVAIISVLTYILLKGSKNSDSDTLVQLTSSLTNQIQDVRKEINDNSEKSRVEIESKLKTINKEILDFQNNSTSSLQKQFAESSKIIKDVTAELAKIKNTNEQVLSFANQMKSLEKILNNPKQRGIFGEIQLENLLSNVLPPEIFKMQYTFSNGETVDAIINVNEKIIPIDAKFSLDNYNKMIESSDENEIRELEKKFKSDIKARIDETSKYIRPEEKTLDYAYMFIPADGLYQDLLNSRVGSLKINSSELVSYAYLKKVMIVSPMSLFPMLEKEIENVIKNVRNLSNHLSSYKVYHDKMGSQLRTVVNHYNKSSEEFKKIDKDVTRISGGKINLNLDSEKIEKPNLSE